jgi:hypothetical protein
MLTHAQLAARLLRDAADFFRHLGQENPALQESMNDNAGIYDQVAQLVEAAPMETIDLPEKGD